ncbi:hypothetical protein H6503_02340 [Candidatus Woesearchaeota archaeon]|nr:hypothetical protein [Candidatus Woesearchaeota archaeon]
MFEQTSERLKKVSSERLDSAKKTARKNIDTAKKTAMKSLELAQKNIERTKQEINKVHHRIKTYPEYVLQYGLSFVFLSAAIYRIFNFSSGINEMHNLLMPFFMVYVVIFFELIVAVFLLFDKLVKIALILVSVFLSISLLFSLVANGTYIIRSLGELFVFDLNPTDFALHLCFLIVSLYLIFVMNLNSKKSMENYK